MTPLQGTPDLAVLAGLLAERGMLGPELTVSAARSAFVKLVREGRLTLQGVVTAPECRSLPEGWASYAQMIEEAWLQATVELTAAVAARPTQPGCDGRKPTPHPGGVGHVTLGLPVAEEDYARSAPPGNEGDERDATEWTPAASSRPGKPAERHLQARVTIADRKAPLTSGFIGGARHQVAVRIAARRSAGTIENLEPFPLRAGVLSVMFHLRGGAAAPVVRELRLRAKGATAWTDPVTLRLPKATPKNTSATIEIVVLHRGRAVQTALLSGPLLNAPGSGRGLRFDVDAPTPLSALADRSPAQGTLIVSVSARGRPVILDPHSDGLTLDSAGIRAASDEVRRILLGALADPPVNLAEAAGPLTQLAVRGSGLHTQMEASGRSDLDKAAWIHVVMLGVADLPFELTYTHPMPDNDTQVPVCGPALGGATQCADRCSDRDRSDRVCPFGFWATSKVVERRHHVPGRHGGPANARVNITDGVVVATSVRTDRADPTASQRIAGAFSALVPPGHSWRTPDWTSLAARMRSGPEPSVLVLVTHTTPDKKVEVGNEIRETHRVDKRLINPDGHEPGPIVLSLGCDTALLDAGFATWVQTLQAARASVVMSAIAPIPGHAIADFIELLCVALRDELASPGRHRLGEAMTAARQRTIASGGLLALALTTTGDGDIELEGA